MSAVSRYAIDDNIEVIIEEPQRYLTTREHLPIIIQATIGQIDRSNGKFGGNYWGLFPFEIAGEIYHIRYHTKIHKILSSLELYSAAIRHIQENIHLYDPILAQVAINELEACFRKNYHD